MTLVEFENVPSFATALDVPIEVPGFGTVPVSVAWGGMACAVVDADALGVELVPDQARARGRGDGGGLRSGPRADRLPASAQRRAGGDRGSRRDGTPARCEGHHARQTCGIPTGQMDTSPSGTGTSAGMAVLHARGRLAVGEAFRTEGLLGGVFDAGSPGRPASGSVHAIVPRIGGRAWITGYATYVLQDDDPFPEGFVMGDIWPAADAGSIAERLAAARRRRPD